MLRLFVGLDLPQDVRQQLALLGRGLPGARWLDPATYHVTLAFVGEIDEGMAEDLDRELATVRGKSFDLKIGGVGSFDSGGRLRALWAGVELSETLAVLQGRVASACQRAGIELEKRKFKPHVSLARFREPPPRNRLGDWLETHALLSIPAFPVRAFVLFESHLGGEGAHYEPLASYPLLG